MLAWIKGSIYMLVVGAVFLLITTDANPTEIPYKECRQKFIDVGTRYDKKSDTSSCMGCEKLRNCTSVFGSVRLKGISFSNRNKHLRKELRFPHLQEITGHLIVTFLQDGATSVSDILPNLAVIHGRVEQLFQGYALVVYKNKGLQNLGLNSLTLIKQGGIKIEFNPQLCYLDRIRWQSLMGNGEAKKYELAMKGNLKDCFEKCSESCNTPSGHGSSGHKYCWGRKKQNCQKLCHARCGSSGCENGRENKCCHKECLGGCTIANSPHHCNACQHLRMGNGSCVATCPPQLKELQEFSCVRDCNGLELNGKCYEKCPVGYKKNETSSTSTCVQCDNCPRECPASGFTKIQKISTLSDSAKFKGCTIINGRLEIEMRNVPGGTNVAKVLTEHFGSVQTIKGYLVVRQSTPLISLDFFKNLTTINVRRGLGFSSKDYALAIFENPNLESLWKFHPDFKITGTAYSYGRGGVLVQLNPRLCLHEIFPLIDEVLKLNRSNAAVDISETTNGNAGSCNVNRVNLTITPVTRSGKSLCVQVSWPNIVPNDDYRNVLLYSVWYREATSTDLSEYDDVDACNSDHVWNRKDLNAKAARRSTIRITIGGLKAHTLYAFRLEAVVIAGGGVKSPVTFFTTKQTKPSMPRDLEVNFLSSSSLQVNWKKPFFPNGEITRYIVRYQETDSSQFWNVDNNWCTTLDPTNRYGGKTEEKSEEGTSVNTSCPVNITCDCENEKNRQDTPDVREALFDKEFQDEIFTSVFSKNDDNDKDRTTRRPTAQTLPNVVRNKTTVSQGCDNNSKNSSCFSESSNTSPTTNPTTVKTTLHPSKFPVIKRNATSQRIILNGLKYFTGYTVEVCACNGAGCGETRLFATGCSTAIGRTGKNDTADNVGNTLYVEKKEKEFTLKWKAPDRPNGVVFRYEILIRYQDIDANTTAIENPCVQASMTSYTKHGASFGFYAAKVRAKTPVGNGSWSNEVTFNITMHDPTGVEAVKEDANLATVIGVSIAAVFAAVVVFAAFTYSFIQRQKKNGNASGVLFSSTNPEYWNCSEVYVPDEWEVQRHNITMIRELGNGSFGMVWEGEAVGILPGVDHCKVAVKTVSDNSSIRDKVEFLKEASIMKAFNCNHVLRLLGVVSAGDPVLVIMELMENGDLKSFLRRRRPDAEEECPLPPPTDIELYQMAAEIADGMAYLADRKFVHRDLAARNCMVSANFTCKIGDFGMARDVYETDYYRKGGKGFLPVRWMAPESLKDGVFCSASDVWSYGIVLWEMATLAEQPYQGKSNEEVMKYVLDCNVMDIPETCPRKLLELMLLCWQYKAKLRPSFLSIVENLEGYLSIEFTERSFYHNGGSRNETDSCSLVSLGTEHDNLSELPDILTDQRNPSAKESFV